MCGSMGDVLPAVLTDDYFPISDTQSSKPYYIVMAWHKSYSSWSKSNILKLSLSSHPVVALPPNAENSSNRFGINFSIRPDEHDPRLFWEELTPIRCGGKRSPRIRR